MAVGGRAAILPSKAAAAATAACRRGATLKASSSKPRCEMRMLNFSDSNKQKLAISSDPKTDIRL